MLKPSICRYSCRLVGGDLRRIHATVSHSRSAAAAAAVRWLSLSANMKQENIVQQPLSAEQEAPALTRLENDTGIILLNRPKKLNSLTPEMGEIVGPTLQAWERSDAVKMIMIKGSGEKAFSAGGDIKGIIDKIKEGNYKEAERGFGVQYRIFHLTGTLKTPYVALLNGITMGGGVGLSAHGPFRVATESTVFAMPETGIGLFNDAGTSFMLPRLDGQLGIYLGLTGKRIKGADVFYSGVATHYVNSHRLPELEERLLSLERKDHRSVNAVLEEYSVDVDRELPNFSLGGGIRSAIDRCFKYNTVEEIVEALENEAKERQWAEETLDMLRKASPTSLKVTLELLRRGARMSLGQCIQTEFKLASQFIREREFVEGVNAVLVDRRAPKWDPPTPKDVKDDVKQKYFEKASTSSNLHLLTSSDIVQYPFSFGLPSDDQIIDALSLNYADLNTLARDRFKGKKGVLSKIRDVANRINVTAAV